MDLKAGNLYWPAIDPPPPALPRLRGRVQCDVLVMGAGISGAMAACLFAEAGLDTVIVDRRGIAAGSTAASTALLQYEIDTPLLELAEHIGLARARQAYRVCRRVLDEIEQLIRRHSIACDLRRTGSLYLAQHPSDAALFAAEVAARRSVGIEVELLEQRQLLDRFDIDRIAALYSHAALELDPYRFTIGLLNSAMQRGVRAYIGEVVPDRLGPRGQVLRGDAAAEIQCTHFVVATGYEAPECFESLRPLCRLKSTYALASAPIDRDEAWPQRVLIWESADPYFYARQTPDNRVLVGGEDEDTADPRRRDALIPRKTSQLIEKLEKLRPGLWLSPQFAWAGTFAETPDGLPLIGTLPRWPGTYFALGYGGNGITFSLVAAQIIRDAILGRDNEDADVFSFERLRAPHRPLNAGAA